MSDIRNTADSPQESAKTELPYESKPESRQQRSPSPRKYAAWGKWLAVLTVLLLLSYLGLVLLDINREDGQTEPAEVQQEKSEQVQEEKLSPLLRLEQLARMDILNSVQDNDLFLTSVGHHRCKDSSALEVGPLKSNLRSLVENEVRRKIASEDIAQEEVFSRDLEDEVYREVVENLCNAVSFAYVNATKKQLYIVPVDVNESRVKTTFKQEIGERGVANRKPLNLDGTEIGFEQAWQVMLQNGGNKLIEYMQEQGEKSIETEAVLWEDPAAPESGPVYRIIVKGAEAFPVSEEEFAYPILMILVDAYNGKVIGVHEMGRDGI